MPVLRYAGGAILIAALLVVAGVLGDETIESSADPLASPTPSVSATAAPATAWEQASATRTMTVHLMLTASDHGWVYGSAEARLEVDNDDAVIRDVQAGRLASRDLIAALGLEMSAGSEPPALRWSTGASRASITVAAHLGGYLERGSVRFRVADRPRAALAGRDITVAASGLRITGVEGASLIRQDAATAQFAGRPDPVAVTVWTDAVPSSPVTSADRIEPDALEQWAAWHPLIPLVITLTPWVLLLTGFARVRRVAALAAPATVIMIFGALPGAWFSDGDMSAVLAFAALLVGAALLRASQGRSWDGTAVLVALVTTGPAAAWLAWFGAGASASLDLRALAAGLALTVPIGAVGFRLLGRPWSSGAAAAIGLSGFACLVNADEPAGADGVSFLALLGVLCTAVVVAGALPALAAAPGTHRLPATAVVATVFGLLMFAPFIGLQTSEPIEDIDVASPFTAIEALLLLVLFGTGIRYLSRRGVRPGAAGDALCGTVLLILLVIVTAQYGDIAWLNVAALLYIVLAWRMLLDRSSVALPLEHISPPAHRRLVAAEIRRRLAALSAHDYYRAARERLREKDLSLADYDAGQEHLDGAASDRLVTDGVRQSLALATTAGRKAWDNAVAAMRYAAPAAVVFALYEFVLLVGSAENAGLLWGSLPDWVLLVIRHFRWLLYALIFGFAYPRLRGRTPVAKALALAVFLLPVELLSMLSAVPEYENPADPEADEILMPATSDIVAAVAIRTGQVVAFCLFLGLCWERRMVNLAGFGWDRFRNFRSFGSLATPAGTVVIAVATAAGTALAGAAVAAMLGSGSPSPPPAPPPSVIVSPSPSPTR